LLAAAAFAQTYNYDESWTDSATIANDGTNGVAATYNLAMNYSAVLNSDGSGSTTYTITFDVTATLEQALGTDTVEFFACAPAANAGCHFVQWDGAANTVEYYYDYAGTPSTMASAASCPYYNPTTRYSIYNVGTNTVTADNPFGNAQITSR